MPPTRNRATLIQWSAILVALVCLLASCGQPLASDGGVSTVPYEPAGDGWVRFKTNDLTKLGSAFSLVLPAGTTPAAPRLLLRKTSGYAYGDFGGLFHAQDADHAYLVLIDVAGNYTVKRRDGPAVTELLPWQPSADLLSGYGSVNEVAFVDTAPGSFAVSFNGGPSIGIDDPSPHPFVGGEAGFFVYIAGENYEAFPGAPVEVLFKMGGTT